MGPTSKLLSHCRSVEANPGENYKVKQEFGDVWQLQQPVFNVNFNLDHLNLKIIGSEFFRHL